MGSPLGRHSKKKRVNNPYSIMPTKIKKSKDEFYTRGKLSVWELLDFIQRHYADDYTLDKEYKITIEETKKENINIRGD